VREAILTPSGMVRDETRRAQTVGGIGRAVAKRLAQDGFTVVVN